MPAVKCVTPRRVSATQGTGPKGGTLRTAIQSQAQTGGCAELGRVGDWRQPAFPGLGEEGLCRWGECAEHGSCGPLVSPGDLHPLHFRHPIGSSPGRCSLRKVLCEDVEDQETRRMRTTTVRVACVWRAAVHPVPFPFPFNPKVDLLLSQAPEDGRGGSPQASPLQSQGAVSEKEQQRGQTQTLYSIQED